MQDPFVVEETCHERHDHYLLKEKPRNALLWYTLEEPTMSQKAPEVLNVKLYIYIYCGEQVEKIWRLIYEDWRKKWRWSHVCCQHYVWLGSNTRLTVLVEVTDLINLALTAQGYGNYWKQCQEEVSVKFQSRCTKLYQAIQPRRATTRFRTSTDWKATPKTPRRPLERHTKAQRC